MTDFDPQSYWDHMMVEGHYECRYRHQTIGTETLDCSVANAADISLTDLRTLISGGVLPARKGREEDHYFLKDQHIAMLCSWKAQGILGNKLDRARENIQRRNRA